jgi:hypothetical protein
MPIRCLWWKFHIHCSGIWSDVRSPVRYWAWPVTYIMEFFFRVTHLSACPEALGSWTNDDWHITESWTSANFLYGPSLFANNLLSYHLPICAFHIHYGLMFWPFTICYFFSYFGLLWKFGVRYSMLWSDGQTSPVNLRLHWSLQESFSLGLNCYKTREGSDFNGTMSFLF